LIRAAGRKTSDHVRTTGDPGDGSSRRIPKWIEEIFGWMSPVALLGMAQADFVAGSAMRQELSLPNTPSALA
jgi:hypothetical protein